MIILFWGLMCLGVSNSELQVALSLSSSLSFSLFLCSLQPQH